MQTKIAVRLLNFIAVALLWFMPCTAQEPFNKVVIWGHKLHTHTHSYIHYGFYKAFTALGYETYWFDDHDDVRAFDFSHSLFITEGQVDHFIPLREDSLYILHNCPSAQYDALPSANRFCLQVYTDDVLKYTTAKKVEPFIFLDREQQIMYMPWATDLLPEEIEANKRLVQFPNSASKQIYWVGSFCGGEFGNNDEINSFIKACKENGVEFIHKPPLHTSPEESIGLIRDSYMAPCIVGTWQKKVGYIPCRIFKNISYGNFAPTNSRHVYELFEQKIVYNPDTYQLFYDAQKRLETMTQEDMFELMDFVKNKHTYINRIQTILSFIKGTY